MPPIVAGKPTGIRLDGGCHDWGILRVHNSLRLLDEPAVNFRDRYIQSRFKALECSKGGWGLAGEISLCLIDDELTPDDRDLTSKTGYQQLSRVTR